jgi:hypothetical protein
MNNIRGILDCAGRCLFFSLAMITLGCAEDPGMRDSAGTTSSAQDAQTKSSQAEDARFTAVEEQGAKLWKPSGPGRVDSASNTVTINAKDRGTKPLQLKVINSLGADHGFAIDSMNVKEVLKPGEEKTISVAPESIDPSFTRHRVYCQLHEKHVPATLIINRDQSPTAESGSPSDLSRPSQSRQGERPSDSTQPTQTRQDERPSDSGRPAQSRQDAGSMGSGSQSGSTAAGMTEGQRMISEQSEHQREIESTSRADKAPSSIDPKACEGFPGFDRGCPGGPK